MNAGEISTKLNEKGLKVTPQRIAVLEAIIKLNNHPTADHIIEYIRSKHPNIATATVYKVLDVLVSNELIKKVKTEKDIMRYDAVLERHHHLYCSESSRIEDFNDEELNNILEMYFKKKEIPDFEIEDVKLQIIGKFTKRDQ
ncbi:transcriptional repressor [Labilibaculum sp.]|uniref:Fur family transcriptional regulator n=1 Tax=Labilibaculum sp. TaxID=2060723 RepID=UPI002AA82C6C|nr:transcriptional repressor [Labilibaculum sp.]MBN2598437.1 transcriptional repressor [Marinifilaceae bacterium]